MCVLWCFGACIRKEPKQALDVDPVPTDSMLLQRMLFKKEE